MTELSDRLSKNETDKRAVLEKMQDEARGQQASLRKLLKTQNELEALLESLTGGEETPPVPPPPGPAVPSESGTPEPAPTIPPRVERPEPFQGNGLEALRGRLVFPVSGRLVQGFGMQRHEEFSEVLFHKGLEMEASSNTAVQAIAPGKVVVEQDLPGIGLTVIVDHGDRYYSLYGQLQSSTKHRGDIVQKGETLGRVGAPAEQGGNFYFEIRFRGKAVDPGPFFSILPGSVTEN
jgi:septal ring factor EnvC (AmiA/AmiB activator)